MSSLKGFFSDCRELQRQEAKAKGSLRAMIRELHHRNGKYGIASLCIGGGQGIAAVFEKI
jgi:predicted metal-dependent RNase